MNANTPLKSHWQANGPQDSAQPAHENRPNGYNVSSKILMAVGYLFLLAAIPNVFGWGLVLLCCMSRSFRELLFEPWLRRNGDALFNVCCWQIQSSLNLLIEPVVDWVSFIVEQSGATIGLSEGTMWMVLLAAPVAYVCAILGWEARVWLNSMLLTCELRVEAVVLVVIVTLVVARRFSKEQPETHEVLSIAR